MGEVFTGGVAEKGTNIMGEDTNKKEVAKSNKRTTKQQTHTAYSSAAPFSGLTARSLQHYGRIFIGDE